MSLADALVGLRDVLAGVRYPLHLPGAEGATALARSTRNQLDDYLIPRLAKIDAPMLVVAGGSTGAGKSTLVNSIVGEPVSPVGARRPTTREPVLVCNPEDATWFRRAGKLSRIEERTSLGPGLALLDTPDIDSVEEANRVLAEQLLAAADLWLFVTTAVRYADAVPWEVLTAARDRGTTVAIVLNRVPAGAEAEVAPHLAQMLTEHGLRTTRTFVVLEQTLGPERLLPPAAIAPIKNWLDELARSAAERAAVIRQTLDGALAALDPSTNRLAEQAAAQTVALKALGDSADIPCREAETEVAQAISDGVLIRGEVLARWQELAGTGEFMRGLQARVGRLRDRIVSAFSGRPMPTEQLKSALESGVVTLVHSVAADAAEKAANAWRAHPAGPALLRPELLEASPEVDARVDRMMRDWQRAVLELVREESSKKLYVAKASAYAVNALGLCLMIAVFAATAFIPTGAEIAVAGGTTIAAQKVLEAIFGDEAVRRLAGKARRDLLDRVSAVLGQEAQRFHAVLAESAVDTGAEQRLRDAAAAVAGQRSAR